MTDPKSAPESRPTTTIPFIRHFAARPRLVLCLVIGCLVYLVSGPLGSVATRLLVSWNAFVVPYVGLAFAMMLTSSEASMRKRAALEDDGRNVALLLTMIATIAGFIAIFAELMLKNTPGLLPDWARIALSAFTILSSWTFVHVVFTQHYAHEFYLERHRDEEGRLVHSGGLRFPGQDPPDYIDFLYFAFTIGVANQTADVEVTSRPMRLLTLVHSVLSYLFNTTILALTINIATSQL